ncbi:MAG: 3-oxoacyl-ACP reductase FabG [Tepidiformaceae bacterium]
MTQLLAGKAAVVTGASRGIGRAVAEELARHGARVAVNYNQSKDAAEELCAVLRASGGDGVAIQADVSDAQAARAFVDQSAAALGGRIDILVNNAGINKDRTLKRMSDAEWDDVIATDLSSMYYCTSAAIPFMTAGGQIVNMSSIIGRMGNVGQANYAAAKAGMIGFTKSAARELARQGITVNAICPGFIETDMLAGVPEEPKNAILAQIPLGRFGRADEIGALVRFLCTEGLWMTGAAIDINGGQYM